jgi:hypothetical protein
MNRFFFVRFFFATLLSFLSIGQTYSNNNIYEKDRDNLFKSIQYFGEANESANNAKSESNADFTNFVTKVKQGISLSDDVSDAYLNSLSPEFASLYRKYSNGYKDVMYLLKEKKPMNEVAAIFSRIDMDQIAFEEYLYKNQHLFDGDIEVRKHPEASFKQAIWFVLKLMLVTITSLLLLAISYIIFSIPSKFVYSIGRPFSYLYLIVVMSIGIFIFAFAGASYYQVYFYYKFVFSMKWILYTVSILAVSNLIISSFQISGQPDNHIFNQEGHGFLSFGLDRCNKPKDFDKAIFNNMIKPSGLSFVFFILFTFAPSYSHNLFGHTAQWIATLWN